MKPMIALVSLFAFIGTLPACATPLQYSADPIEAWVVDAETKQPLEGVIVTANWQLFHSTVGGRVPGDQLMVMETVTGKDGRFHFPAWDPKLALSGYLDNRDPQLLLFKPGYEYKRLENEVSSKTNMALRRRSQWNGKTIELKPFKGTVKEYSSHLSFLKTSLRFVEENCNWKKTPVILIALDKQRQIFRANGIDSGIYSLDYFDGLSDQEMKKCGSPSAFFKEQKR